MKLVGIQTKGKGLPLHKHLSNAQEWEQWVVEQADGDHVLIIHNLVGAEGHLNELKGCDAWTRVRGILFVKEAVYAGIIGKGAAEQWNAWTEGPSVHVLSYVVPNVDGNCSSSIGHRFERFREAISVLRAGSEIPWPLLEPPPWPEEAVALYLALVAHERGVSVLREIDGEMAKKANEQMQELVAVHGSPETKWVPFQVADPSKKQNVAEQLRIMRQVFGKVAEERK